MHATWYGHTCGPERAEFVGHMCYTHIRQVFFFCMAMIGLSSPKYVCVYVCQGCLLHGPAYAASTLYCSKNCLPTLVGR